MSDASLESIFAKCGGCLFFEFDREAWVPGCRLGNVSEVCQSFKPGPNCPYCRDGIGRYGDDVVVCDACGARGSTIADFLQGMNP